MLFDEVLCWFQHFSWSSEAVQHVSPDFCSNTPDLPSSGSVITESGALEQSTQVKQGDQARTTSGSESPAEAELTSDYQE